MTWQEAVGVSVHDGYGQTETGHLTGMPIGPPVRPGSMGRPLPGLRGLDRARASWWSTRPRCRPSSSTATASARGAPATASREDEDGYLWFEGRTDDVIISAGYRIGPFEVESALVAHPAVAEAAAVAAPDEVRGQVVRAVVVLQPGFEPSATLAGELQDHVKGATAPYKYPRIVDFADGAAEDAERQDPTRRPTRRGRVTRGSGAAAGRSPASARATRARRCPRLAAA